MTIDASALASVQFNSSKESACSPKVDRDFRGIVIASPPQADLRGPWADYLGFERPRPLLAVCGTAQFSEATDAKFQSLSNEILLVAVDAKSHRPYVSNLLRKGFEPALSRPATPEEAIAWKNRVHRTWFNANAFYYLEDLPARPAAYHVFAMAGEMVSNVNHVEVIGAGDEKAPHQEDAPGQVSFGKGAAALPIDSKFRGVRITARVQRWPSPHDSTPVWIDGVVQLDGKDAAALGVTPIQRAVVVTASSGFIYRSWNVAGERPLFPDDQERHNDIVRGTFSVELSAAFGTSRDRDAYVLVSVGPNVSNVLHIPRS